MPRERDGRYAIFAALALAGCSGPPTAVAGPGAGGASASGSAGSEQAPSGVASCQELTFLHEPPASWGGARVPDSCEDAEGRIGYELYGNCEVPDQERVEVCNLCRVDADCTARPDGRCIGVRVSGPTQWGGYAQCVYREDPGHPSHAPPCPPPGAATPEPSQYVSVSWQVECVAAQPGSPCRWGTCARHENRALP